MSTITLIIAATCLALGFYLGHRAKPPASGAACPRCRQMRLYYCRGCGHHFDEMDEAIDPREFDRMTLPNFHEDEVER